MTSQTGSGGERVGKAYLDFYGALDIIPVRQDLSDLPRHFQRRAALYAQLGLLPNAVRGCRVLEVGPGTGDNAMHTASLLPEQYVLLDANPASLAALRGKIGDGLLSASVKVVEADFLTYRTDERFDVVLCEGLLPAQNAPIPFLDKLLDMTAPGGVTVITTVSFTSLFAETCRRVLRLFFEMPDRSVAETVKELASFFGPDLRSLPGMSRLHEDWVLDQIIHPYTEVVAFPLRDAILAAAPKAEPAGTSPRFLTDWRWYKSVPDSGIAQTDFVLEQVDRFSLTMLDYRMSPIATDPALGQAVEERCRALWLRHLDVLNGRDPAALEDFATAVSEIGAMLPVGFEEARLSVTDYVAALRSWVAGHRAVEFGRFRPLFGRGQQYLMLLRHMV
ncbi:class I SAM-dependent methyltransferase [Azospirillum sp.]|uniref:class I SAM-dependent methyltransferase n=1 Tax=Azospirillum sp. TaxID=34012 RepID=UPI002633021E|nr:class I SAM-dependent methyltransferase [Azospirillum sp.]